MPEYDVFVSYAHADAAAVAPLVGALRGQGLEVWQDASDIPPFESITDRIVDGLGRAKAMLAWYSATYPTRRACQWELTAGYLAAQHEGDVRQRVLVANPEDGGNHIHPIELRDQLFVTAGDLADADEVAGRIAAHVESLAGRLGEIRALDAPRWYGSVPSTGEGFVGRQADLWEVHSTVAGPDVAIITGRPAAAAQAQISGLGGVGKSMLAEEYGLRYGAAYPGGVFWLRAYGNDDTKAALDATAREGERQSQMLGLATSLELPIEGLTPPQVDAAVFAALDRRGERCLWVVDDMPSDLDAAGVKAWACQATSGRTLYTTRSRQYGKLAGTIDLGVLDDEAAYQLLVSERQPSDDDEADAARGIVADLGGHALALAVSAGALAERAGVQTFAEYRAGLAQPGAAVLELAAELTDVLPTGHGPSIVQTMLHSIERIGDADFDFLLLASVLAPSPIPPSLVVAVLAVADELDEDEAKTRAVRGMQRAGERSLADQAAADGARSVHTLVSRVVQSTAEARAPERRDRLRAAALEVATALMPAAADIRRHGEVEPLPPHARELARPLSDPQEADVLGWLARFDHERGAYALARRDYEQQLAAQRRLLGDDHPDTLGAMNNLGQILHAQGDLPTARQLADHVLTTSRRVLGDDHPNTLRAMNNLGQILQAQGDLPAARQLADDVLTTYRRVLGDDHPDTLTAMNNLVTLHYAQGDLPAARQLADDVLTTYRRVLGDDHPDTLIAMNNLSQILQAQGDLPAARQLAGQVLVTIRRIHGNDHPDTLTAKNNLATILQAQGDLPAARQLADDVLTTRRRVLGDDHPDTLTAMNNVATLRHAEGDLPAARQLAEEVLAAFLRVLGDEHHNTGVAAGNLLALLLEIGDQEAAAALVAEMPGAFGQMSEGRDD